MQWIMDGHWVVFVHGLSVRLIFEFRFCRALELLEFTVLSHQLKVDFKLNNISLNTIKIKHIVIYNELSTFDLLNSDLLIELEPS